MATMYATDQVGADRKRKAVARMRAAQLAAQMLHQATQQQGLPQSPTPPKPVMPVKGGPGPGRPIVSGGQDGVLHAQPPYRPSLADARGLDPQLGPGLAGARRYANGLAGRGNGMVGDALPLRRGPLSDVVRHIRSGPPEYINGDGQGASNLRTGRPYGQAVQMPERRPPGEHLPGKPSLGGRPLFGGPDNGRPIVKPLEEQLALRHAEQQQRTGLGAQPGRRRRRGGGAALLAQILGGFSRG
jgi:hypothetical protein